MRGHLTVTEQLPCFESCCFLALIFVVFDAMGFLVEARHAMPCRWAIDGSDRVAAQASHEHALLPRFMHQVARPSGAHNPTGPARIGASTTEPPSQPFTYALCMYCVAVLPHLYCPITAINQLYCSRTAPMSDPTGAHRG